MRLNKSSFYGKDLELALSFESTLVKLYFRNTFGKWIEIGAALHEHGRDHTSKTEREIFSIQNLSASKTETHEKVFGSLKDLSKQIKALLPHYPIVDVWIPDELILCQTLLHKHKLTESEATEIVAKSCKMKTDELCLVLSPEYRERSQKISAVTFEAIDNIRSFLNNYGILAKKFKAKDPQPGFASSPTFYEDNDVNFKPNMMRQITNMAPNFFAIILALFTFASIVSDKNLQTQTSIRSITNLIEEENFSLKSPLSLEILTETTFPYFAPQLSNTMERKVFRLTSYDVGSKLIAPQLRNDSENDKPLDLKLGSSDITDDFAIVVLTTKSLDLSKSFDYQMGSKQLRTDIEVKPTKLDLTFLNLPEAQQKPNYFYEEKELGFGLLSQYPYLKEIQVETNDFKMVHPIEIQPTTPIPIFLSLETLSDETEENYLYTLGSDEYVPISFKKSRIAEPDIQDQTIIKAPNISGYKITKLNINPARLDQPNLLIDKLASNGKVTVEIPTVSSDIEYIVLKNDSRFLPTRPKIQDRLALKEPTMSSGALGFLNYPSARPKNMKDIANILSSKNRIHAKASVGPRIPNRSFAPAMATLSNRIELDRTNLLGVFGSKSKPYALIMLSNGEMIKISVGDQFLGWRVYGIDENTVHVQNGMKHEILRIPG